MKKIREKYLLVRIQQDKDADSFSQVYNYLVEPIYRFVYFKVSDTETARDLTAEVFLKCWKELTSSRQGKVQIQHLRAYFYKTARHLVIDYYRSSQQTKELPIQEGIPIPDVENVHQKVEARIDSEFVLEFVKKLKESYQEIIILRHIEELSLAEISKILGKSPVSTRVLLHRANQALKREYEQATTKSQESS